jgi:hypothetical protein
MNEQMPIDQLAEQILARSVGLINYNRLKKLAGGRVTGEAPPLTWYDLLDACINVGVETAITEYNAAALRYQMGDRT